MVFASSEVTDVGISPHRAPLRFYQHRQHCFDVSGVLGQPGRSAGRKVMESLHVLRQLATKFVNARDQGLKVIPVFNTGRLSDFLYGLSLESD